ncbi:MAG: hypothetical protein ACOZNI_35580 [Myxococcota bacterium]
MREILKGAVAGAGATLALLACLLGNPAEATPVYSLQTVNACDTCHIEPSGWKNPEMKDRRCTMDCSSCHVSPTGGAMRNTTGRFFAREKLPMFGTRPTKGEDLAAKYLPEGHPTEGRYRLGEGFSGWWPGEKPMEDVPDRYGFLKPDPKLAFGLDFRFMVYAPLGADLKAFPMQYDMYLSYRPLYNLVLYGSGGLMGRQANDLTDKGDKVISAAAREVFAKVDRLPYNSYVLAGRFNLPYGWRLPDHTAYIRRNLGLDQNRQVFGVMAGTNPNYPFVHAALFTQGADWWPGDTGEDGFGAAVSGGVRELGWHLAGSAMAYRRRDGFDDIQFGPQWGLNLYPVAYLGEVDFRRQTDPAVSKEGFFAYHEVDWRLVEPLVLKAKYEWMDDDLELKDNHLNRLGAGVEWHPYTYTHVEAQYRATFTGGGVALAGSEFTGNEILVMLHGHL